MLPEDFCELFSINPKENRLAVTLVFKITKNKIKFVEYFRSVIKSRVALSYENA
jgi:exoribonuclease R